MIKTIIILILIFIISVYATNNHRKTECINMLVQMKYSATDKLIVQHIYNACVNGEIDFNNILQCFCYNTNENNECLAWNCLEIKPQKAYAFNAY